MSEKKMNGVLQREGILIPVDELVELLEQHREDEIDEVTFQKKAAELIIEWAAKESSVKTSLTRERVVDEESGTYIGEAVSAVGQILVDVVPKPQEEWKPTEAE